MAVLTISGTALLCITALNHLTGFDRRYYWLILAGLPLSPIVNEFIKTPVITSIAASAEVPLNLAPEAPLWFVLAIWLNAPIFEEAIKLLPVVLPASRIFLQDAARTLWAGLAVGMGFGLGEAMYLGYGIAQSPDYNQLPWHMFTGFATERLIVTFAHGLMTSIAIAGFYAGKRRALLGYLSAVGLHALINLGPILLALKLIPATVSSLGSYAVILGAFLLFQKHAHTARKVSGIAPQEILYFER
jgi:uncharacterized membrane protein YhfC